MGPPSPPAASIAVCPDAGRFHARLQKQLDAAIRKGDSPWVEVEFVGQDGMKVSGRVSLIPAPTPAFSRQVVGVTCSEVMQALALSFELYLDELIAEQPSLGPAAPCAPEQEPPRSGPQGPKREWPGPDIDPFTLPKAGYRDAPPPRPSIPERPPLGSAQGAVSVGTAILPGVSLGLGISYRARLEGDTLVLVGLHHHLGSPFAVDQQLYAFSGTAVSLAFGRYFSTPGPIRIGLAAGPRLNMLHVAWAEETEQWTHHFGAALTTSVDFALHFESGWSTGLRGELLVHLLRSRFLTGDGTEVWVQPWVGGEVGWFLAANFW